MKKSLLVLFLLFLGISSFAQVNFTIEIKVDGHGIAEADQLSLGDFTWSMTNKRTGKTITSDKAIFQLPMNVEGTQAFMVDVDEFSMQGGLEIGDEIVFQVNIIRGKYAGYFGSVICNWSYPGSMDFLGDKGINAEFSKNNVICKIL